MWRNRVPILAQKPSNRTMQIVIFIKLHFSLVYKHKLAVFGCIYAISGLASTTRFLHTISREYTLALHSFYIAVS